MIKERIYIDDIYKLFSIYMSICEDHQQKHQRLHSALLSRYYLHEKYLLGSNLLRENSFSESWHIIQASLRLTFQRWSPTNIRTIVKCMIVNLLSQLNAVAPIAIIPCKHTAMILIHSVDALPSVLILFGRSVLIFMLWCTIECVGGEFGYFM